MSAPLAAYEGVLSQAILSQLRFLGKKLDGLRVVHVNSTREGGGVAEILEWMPPLMRELGLDASWEVIHGNHRFFEITKAIHNGLQGQPVVLSKEDWNIYQDVNEQNLARLSSSLEDADIVVIHDPQPAGLLNLCPNRKGKWIWRAHLDISRPYGPAWNTLRSHVENYDASIFSMRESAWPLPHPQFLIPPGIDPLSVKNRELVPEEIDCVRAEFGIDPDRPLLVQISRFDRFKDPLGVIQAYRLVRRETSVQLVLAGGEASDDPEGTVFMEEVTRDADGDPDIHILSLPSDVHRTINALQRMADIIVQKSTREGFGLTVAEGMWKGKPVIGGDVGGIRLQVQHRHNGFLVNTTEDTADRIRYLLSHRELLQKMGENARESVKENFLLGRQLRDYLNLFLTIRSENN